jgi:hypothetical protein
MTFSLLLLLILLYSWLIRHYAAPLPRFAYGHRLRHGYYRGWPLLAATLRHYATISATAAIAPPAAELLSHRRLMVTHSFSHSISNIALLHTAFIE